MGGALLDGFWPRRRWMANYGGTLTVINSTISGNSTATISVSAAGGGVFNSGRHAQRDEQHHLWESRPAGGGVRNYGGTLTVTNSTISGNSGTYGGGDEAVGGSATTTDRPSPTSTISGNCSLDDGGGVGNARWHRSPSPTAPSPVIRAPVTAPAAAAWPTSAPSPSPTAPSPAI